MASPAISFGHTANAPSPATRADRAPQSEVLRLAALHREAEDTARLANLVGRAPYAAAMLAVGSGLAAAFSILATDAVSITAWLVLMLMGIVAFARAYNLAIRAPFERGPLATFSQDLTAILTYTGFAWGAGAFLVLPAATGPFAALAFAMGPPALLAGLLRTKSTTLGFLAPVTVLAPLAMLARPLPDGAFAAVLTLVAAGLIAGLSLWHDARSSERHGFPNIAGLLFS